MYDDHLRLIGERIVDFLLVLVNFFAVGVTAEALRPKIVENRRFARWWVSIRQICA